MSLFKFASLIFELDNDLVVSFYIPLWFESLFSFMESIDDNQSNQNLWIYKYIEMKLSRIDASIFCLFVR